MSSSGPWLPILQHRPGACYGDGCCGACVVVRLAVAPELSRGATTGRCDAQRSVAASQEQLLRRRSSSCCGVAITVVAASQ